MSHRPHYGPPAALGVVALALALGGCAESGNTIARSGIVAPARNALSDRSWRYSCERTFDPSTGAVTEKVTVEDNTAPNDHALDVVSALGTAAIGKIPSPVPGLPPGFSRATPAPAPLSAEACLGMHFQGDKGDPPNPIPSRWQQSDAAPYLDADGVAHSADDEGRRS
jgi:hypothetical protein